MHFKNKTLWIYVCFLVVLAILFQLSASYILRSRKIKKEDFEQAKKLMDSNILALYEFEPEISYMFKPNFSGIRHGSDEFVHRTNSRRLLGDREISSSHQRKILFLGDSVTYGDGVQYEKIFTMRLQGLAGNTWQLLNGSCPGWSTRQEALFYQKFLSDIKWDAVVINFCLNDLLNYEWIYDSDTSFKMSSELDNIGGLFGVKSKVAESVRLWEIRRNFGLNKKTKPLSLHNNTCLIAWETDKWQEYYAETLSRLFLINNHTLLIVVAFPSRFQMEALNLGAPADVVLYQQGMLRAYCKAANVLFIDLSRAFTGKEGSVALDDIFFDDLHLTPKGHESAAAYLWPRLNRAVHQRTISNN